MEENKRGDEESVILHNRKAAKLKYILEEKRQDDHGNIIIIKNPNDYIEPTKFNGYEDNVFSCGKDGSTNYALLIYSVIMIMIIL